MEKKHNKIEAHVIVLSTRHSIYYGVAFFLALFLCSIVLALLYFNSIQFSLDVIIGISTLFILFFVGCLLTKAEFVIYANNNFERKPPLQFIFSTIVVLLYAFFGIRAIETFRMDARFYPVITVTILALLLGGGIKILFYYFFIFVLRLFDRVKRHQLLSFTDFSSEMNHKIHDFKRYKTSFSCILLGIWVNEKYRVKLDKILEFPLFFEIIRRNIRTNDLLGISRMGDHALILSVNNDTAKASRHAERIVKVLRDDPILRKMINITSPEYKFVVEEVKVDTEDSRAIITNAERNLQKVYAERDEAFRSGNEAHQATVQEK
jgi:hypothetical protein